MSLMCYQASVPGTSHLALGIPNQDSFAVRIVRSGWSSTCVAPGGTRVRRVRGDEFVVAAVTDGLGSAELSDLGSAAAAPAGGHVTPKLRFRAKKHKSFLLSNSAGRSPKTRPAVCFDQL